MGIVSIGFCEFGGLRLGRTQPLVEADGFQAEIIVPTMSSQQSAPAQKEFVRIATNVAIFVSFGTNPDARTNGILMPANTSETFRTSIGNRVAVALVEQPAAVAPPAPEPVPQPEP